MHFANSTAEALDGWRANRAHLRAISPDPVSLAWPIFAVRLISKPLYCQWKSWRV
jgi:hypothetical protein